MARKLSFIDHHRQDYHDVTWRPEHDGHVGEFYIGDYVRDGGVDRRGEMSLKLYQFTNGDAAPFLRGRRDEFLSVAIDCFMDGLGTLRELERLGVIEAIRRTDLRGRDDLARLLLDRGLRDRSNHKLKVA